MPTSMRACRLDIPTITARPLSRRTNPRCSPRPTGPARTPARSQTRTGARPCQHYWAYCTHLDEQWGRVLTLLDELGIAENTVVAFGVDHGEMLGAHGNFDKGPYFYEEIMHIPIIVRDPLGRQPRSPDGLRQPARPVSHADLAGRGGGRADAGRSALAPTGSRTTSRPFTAMTATRAASSSCAASAQSAASTTGARTTCASCTTWRPIPASGPT